jgi:hypothetical protein
MMRIMTQREFNLAMRAAFDSLLKGTPHSRVPAVLGRKAQYKNCCIELYGPFFVGWYLHMYVRWSCSPLLPPPWRESMAVPRYVILKGKFKGNLFCMEPAQELRIAQARISELATKFPGEYAIFDRRAEKIIDRANSRWATFEAYTSDLIH